MPAIPPEADSCDEDITDHEGEAESSSTCTRHGHIHRQDRAKIYDLSEDELLEAEDDAPPFEAREIKIVKDRHVQTFYELLEVLGKGRFGLVYRCQEKSTARIFAAKFIEIKRPQERKEVENEIELMNILRHPRLLQVYDAFDEGSKMTIIMELATGGELFSRVIDDEFVLTEKVCVLFMRQICEGVEFIHSKNIIHLDMKPENILCVSPTSNRIKLIDFGLSRLYKKGEIIKALFGTPEFVAPEVINYDPITPASDMWSVGVICYILLSGLSPFMGDTDVETLSNVTNAAWDFEDECFDAISSDAKNFITQLLERKPQKRMTATQCLNHKWLSKRKQSDDHELSTIKLRRFVIRRRWQKIFNTIRALRRMGSTFSNPEEELDDEIENHTIETEAKSKEDEGHLNESVVTDDDSQSLALEFHADVTANFTPGSSCESYSPCSLFLEDAGINLESPIMETPRDEYQTELSEYQPDCELNSPKTVELKVLEENEQDRESPEMELFSEDSLDLLSDAESLDSGRMLETTAT